MALIRLIALVLLCASPAVAQDPLRIEITEGVGEPLAIAMPAFADEGGAGSLAEEVRGVIAADLARSGLFREIPPQAHIARPAGIDTPVAWEDWRVLNADALVLGAARIEAGQIYVKFRLYDVVAGQLLGQGMQFDVAQADWRRVAHKVADQILARLTGEGAVFDSRIAYVAETGPADARVKRLALTDSDGAGTAYLTDGTTLALAPRFAADGQRLTYITYAGGRPQAMALNLDDMRSSPLPASFGKAIYGVEASADGRWLAVTQEAAGNTDIWLIDAATGAGRQLTSGPEIDTAPSFSPDATRLVFESDRSGQPQLYLMTLASGAVTRLSAGDSREGAPAWSPSGDFIAYAQGDAGGARGESVIGLIRADGTGARMLTASFLDGGPAWSPNGRMIAFTRRDRDGSRPRLAVVDAFGGGVQEIETETAASDPDWGPVLP